VIVVSHDREFLNGLVNKVYEFGNKKVREHLGGIYEFLQYKKMDTLRELEVSTQKAAVENSVKAVSENKQSYEARKEISKKIKKTEKAVEDIEKQIAAFETEIAAMDKQLENPTVASDSDFIQLYQRKKRELEQKVYEWELLSEELDEVRSLQ
jgi:ATP-binding cassette subfamily F protein 3